MLQRLWHPRVLTLLDQFPVVGLVGSRQCGKTTLARQVAATRGVPPPLHLDLQLPSDRQRLGEPELFLGEHEQTLVILDEIHYVPRLFPVLRALIDRNRRNGRYLVLGSASPELLKQGSESLAGRIAWVDLPPFVLPEVQAGTTMGEGATRELWIRGGYPSSFLAADLEQSREWRRAYMATFLERDLPQLGVRVSAVRLHRFWQMLAHWQGQVFNASAFARSFDVSAPTIRHYLDLLTDTRVVRQLQPFHANLKKRLVKSPKVYLRDSGLLHALLGIADHDALLGHPILGASFEGFAVEQIVSLLPSGATASFFSAHSGAEIDLVLEFDARTRIGVEIKHGAAPRIGPRFAETLAEIGCSEGYVVTAGQTEYPLGKGIRVMPLGRFLESIVRPRGQLWM